MLSSCLSDNELKSRLAPLRFLVGWGVHPKQSRTMLCSIFFPPVAMLMDLFKSCVPDSVKSVTFVCKALWCKLHLIYVVFHVQFKRPRILRS